MKRPDLVTCTDAEFDAWCKYEETKWKYQVFAPEPHEAFRQMLYNTSEPLAWCCEMFGDILDLDEEEIPDGWADEDLTPWWSYQSFTYTSKLADNLFAEKHGIKYYFQREDDAMLFIFTWKHYNPIILNWKDSK